MAHRTEHGITFFDFETISEAQALLDLDDERDFEEEAFNQALLDEARLEAEAEQDREYEEEPCCLLYREMYPEDHEYACPRRVRSVNRI